jgi:unsaturated rhamnogalacturonyl hydrolase
MGKQTIRAVMSGICVWAIIGSQLANGQVIMNDQNPAVGDAPAAPGSFAIDVSPALTPIAIQSAMRKVATWQIARIAKTPSQDWTFATLYLGLLAASDTLHDQSIHDTVLAVANHYDWALGPRQGNADDQAIGQVYLELYRKHPEAKRIASIRKQYDTVMRSPDSEALPVWWWCDALFMAPPVWAGLADASEDPKYLSYMDREWHITSDLLWDSQEHLFYRDKSYLAKHEENGSKVFWSRGNGWVMGGLVAVLEHMRNDDPRRGFYVTKLQDMADSIAKLQGKDGLWRAGLLDPSAYTNPEISGSAFFIYAIVWGMRHGLLSVDRFRPVVERGWEGIIHHIYADGRLGDIQPVGEAPGAYAPSASSVFGIGAFLLAGSQLDAWVKSKPISERHLRGIQH